ncbi:hypothetical protein PVAP13_6KG244312 [Panicum virgatum]|uniref:Uncharacterized protein n=1 Tax=Panicum virgatum TaxID=38727 RepID=A0A8T0RD18_PANVG|nr:hypothetical protein PVAP13_6KG244312 [Panicum virgatum]
MCLPRAVCPPIASLRAWMCPPFALPPRPLGHPLTAQCPTVPRSRGHASLSSTSTRHASRQFHLAAALTPPLPSLSRARATRLRRRCSPTGGRFTTSAARHAAATAHQQEADSPTPPRDTPPPLRTNRRPIHQLRRATRRQRWPYSGQIMEQLRSRIATTKQLRSRPPPAGFRPNPALSAEKIGDCKH